jgi:hypothetical protein
MADKITIVTQLHPGINVKGAGTPQVAWQFPFTARGLMRAVDVFPAHCRAMEQANGNIGCGASWIEIRGQRFRQFGTPSDLDDLDRQAFAQDVKYRRSHFLPHISRTTLAQRILDGINTGKTHA